MTFEQMRKYDELYMRGERLELEIDELIELIELKIIRVSARADSVKDDE
jgi:hypothetical protein